MRSKAEIIAQNEDLEGTANRMAADVDQYVSDMQAEVLNIRSCIKRAAMDGSVFDDIKKVLDTELNKIVLTTDEMSDLSGRLKGKAKEYGHMIDILKGNVSE